VSFTPHVPAPATEARPKWLGLAAVGVVVISVFLIVAGLTTPLSIVFVARNPFASLPGMSPEMAKVFAAQQKMMAFPAGPVSLLVGSAGLAAGVWGLVSAIKVLSRRSEARTPFRRSILALMLAESVSIVVSVWLQTRNAELMGEFAKAMVPPGGSSPHPFETLMTRFLHAGAVLGIVLTLAWGAVKIAFLAWAHRYAGTPSVIDHLDRGVSAARQVER
jgi:hypothetical protein